MVIETGDIENGGTDCLITLQFFGSNGTATPITLSKKEDIFERANVDNFDVRI